MKEDVIEYDVVVIGAGGAGMSAAITAAKHGCKVLLTEKSPYFGGTTAWSGGGVWIPCNRMMQEVGLSDTREAAEEYIRAAVGPWLREDRLKAFLDNGPDMIDFFVKNTAVTFMPRALFPDYYTERAGGMVGGRSLGSAVYDGRTLGPWLKKLRAPLKEFNAPMGMMLGPLDVMQVLQMTSSWQAFVYTAKLGLRYVKDLLTHGRATRLTMGTALAARLLRSSVDVGVTMWDSSPARKLLKEDDRVVGAVIEHDGRQVAVRARRGVVIATGGFSHDPGLRAKYLPFPQQHYSMMAEGNVGDGLSMACAVGAVMDKPNRRNIFGVVVSLLKKPDGSVVRCPHFITDLPKPGCIAVNKAGKRFGDEANLELVFAMSDTASVPAYLVCDSKFIYKYGLGLVWPWALRKRMMLRKGYLKQGNTLPELAHKLGIDANEFERTVARFNGFARSGDDLDFGRGRSALDRSLGDRANQPNPCLGPIEQGPFYAVEIFPGDVSSTAGLRADANGQAVDADDVPIPGLYVCGNDANSLWAGNGLANGVYNGPSLTFGYIIGKQLAQ